MCTITISEDRRIKSILEDKTSQTEKIAQAHRTSQTDSPHCTEVCAPSTGLKRKTSDKNECKKETGESEDHKHNQREKNRTPHLKNGRTDHLTDGRTDHLKGPPAVIPLTSSSDATPVTATCHVTPDSDEEDLRREMDSWTMVKRTISQKDQTKEDEAHHVVNEVYLPTSVLEVSSDPHGHEATSHGHETTSHGHGATSHGDAPMVTSHGDASVVTSKHAHDTALAGSLGSMPPIVHQPESVDDGGGCGCFSKPTRHEASHSKWEINSDDDVLKPPSFLPFSVFVCIFCNAFDCCLGILALFFSVQSEADYRFGNLEEARKKGKLALRVAFAGLVLGFVTVLVLIVLFSTGVFSSLMHSHYADYYNQKPPPLVSVYNPGTIH